MSFLKVRITSLILFLGCSVLAQNKKEYLFGIGIGYAYLNNNQHGYELNNRFLFPLKNKLSLVVIGGIQSTFMHDTTLVASLLYDKPFTNDRTFYADWFFSPSLSFEPVKNLLFYVGPILRKVNRTHSNTQNFYYYNSDGSLRKIVPVERTDYVFGLKPGFSVGLDYEKRLSKNLMILPRVNYQIYRNNYYNSLSAAVALIPDFDNLKKETRKTTPFRNDLRTGIAFTNTDYKDFALNYYQNQYTRVLTRSFNLTASLGTFNIKNIENSEYYQEYPPFKTIATGIINSENVEYKFVKFKQSRIKAGSGISFIYYKDVWRTIVTDLVTDFNNEPKWSTTEDGLYNERSDYSKSIAVGYNAYVEYEHDINARILASIRVQRQTFSDYFIINSVGVSAGYRF